MRRAKDLAGKAKQKASDAREERGETKAAGRAAMHYEAEVNRGSLSVKYLTPTLNGRWNSGWRLAHILEQDGNTVFIWERREE